MVSCRVNGFNSNARDTQRGSDESTVAVPLMSLCTSFQRFDATLSRLATLQHALLCFAALCLW
jgi:hypothetical protein